MLHWLPVEAHIHYKTMVLDYGAARGTAPSLPSSYLQSLHPNPSTSFFHLWSHGPPTPMCGQLPLSPVQGLLCPGTTMLEPASP
jgi:hypothetical protein